jgi:threonine dehydrogenase-like Zn-dependent dehydrogenase
MKAAIVTEPGLLSVGEAPTPKPGRYDALCELLYGATCTGTDSHIIRGSFPFPIDYPCILGHESVGRVVEIGPKVKNFRLGDLVTRVGAPPSADGSLAVAWGGFSEYGLARDHWAMRADGHPESDWSGWRVNQVLPAGIDPRVAPMFTTWRETLSYVTRMGMGPRSRVLVVGSGGNGLSFAAHAVLLGAPSVWMVGAARCETAARGLGISGYLPYTSEDCIAVLKREKPEGFDIVIDAVGKVGLADRFLPLLAPEGRLGIYGIDDFSRVAVSPRFARGTFTLWSGGYDEAETHHRVTELVLQARLSVSAWYDPDKAWPLDRIGEAFQALRDREAVKMLIRLKG